MGHRSHRVQHLIIHHLHDSLHLLASYVHTIHRLHNPARLHASNKRLALGIAWVPRLWGNLHNNCTLATNTWSITRDAERTFLKLRIIGSIAQQVVYTNTSRHIYSTQVNWC